MNKSFLAVIFSVTLLQGILSASLPAPVSTPRPQTYQKKADFSTGRFVGMTEAEAAIVLAQDLKEQRERAKSERR